MLVVRLKRNVSFAHKMKTTKSILSLFKLTLSTYLGIKNKKRGCPFETASFLFLLSTVG
jgi:hypothetical protein